MNITFAPRGILQIDDARITYKNFSGEASQYNREGDRNFALVIPDCMAERPDTKELMPLVDILNEDGWNVKIKPPRDEEDSPFMYMNVKVKFNDRGPNCWLVTKGVKNKLDEESISCLDHIEIDSVDLDIRPYDWGPIGADKKYGRTAYLQGIKVTQKVRDRFADEEYPEE